MKIHTRFDVADCKNKDKVYDRHDNVDRLSYVDSTALIKRFVNEGKSLQQARAAALKSGMYSGDMEEIDKDSAFVAPVYGVDPTIAQPMIESALSSLNNGAASQQQPVHEDAQQPNPTGADAAATAAE